MSWSFYGVGKKPALQREVKAANFNDHPLEKELMEHLVNQLNDGVGYNVAAAGSASPYTASVQINISTVNLVE